MQVAAGDNVADAQQIQRRIQGDFGHAQLPTDADSSLEDFERGERDVLVPVFDCPWTRRGATTSACTAGLAGCSIPIAPRSFAATTRCSRSSTCARRPTSTTTCFPGRTVHPRREPSERQSRDDGSAQRRTAAGRVLTRARHVGELDRIVGRELAEAGQASDAMKADVLAAPHERRSDRRCPARGRWPGNWCRTWPTVMVMEDDDFARTLVGRAPDPAAWETVFAVDAAGALAQLRRQRPDLIR